MAASERLMQEPPVVLVGLGHAVGHIHEQPAREREERNARRELDRVAIQVGE